MTAWSFDLVALGHHDAAFLSQSHVVEDGRGPIVGASGGQSVFLRSRPKRGACGKHVLKRNNRDLVDRFDRALRGGVVATQGFDRVADELDADRRRVAGGKDVDNAASHGEFAVFVGRILPREACIDEELGEIGRRDVLSRLQIERRAKQSPAAR